MSYDSNTGRLQRRARVAFLAIGAAFFAPAIKAQQVTGSEIDGRVVDPSGGSVAGAAVKATNTDTDLTRTATTDSDGRYALTNLPVGHYQLEASAQGFKKYLQKGIELQVATNPFILINLEIGALTETVQVNANAAQVETKDNSVAQVVDAQRMVDLPLNGRNLTQLLTINSYSTSSMNLRGGDLTGSKNMEGSDGSSTTSVAGGAANGVNYLLDGGDNNDAFSNVNLPIPFPDAVQEFNVQTSGLSAQYGLHTGGAVNIVTKSGTNEFHGDFFDFLRNGDLNARPDGVVGHQPLRDSLKRNQFGGTIGGPIRKEKLFFFAGYQGTRQRSDATDRTAYVPTAAALAGNFSVLDGAIANGGCLNTARTLRDPNGNPYPNNQIPVSSFDPAGKKLATTYLPTSPNPCGNYEYGYPANDPDDEIIGRVDYNYSAKSAFFVRYFIYDFTAQYLFDGTNALTTSQPGNQERSQTVTFGNNYAINGTNINAFHATFDRRRDNRASTLFSPQNLGVNMFINTPTYSQISLSSYSGGGFNIGCGTCALANFDVNTYQVADDYTMIRGKHQIQVGFDGRKDQYNSYNYQQANGQFSFNGSTTGDGLADLLIGRFSNLTDGNVISDYLRQTVVAAYAQDTFHATNHITFNLGLRWEPYLPEYDKYGRGDQFSLPLFQQNFHSSVYPNAPAGLVFNGDKQDPYGKALTASHWATFSPRVGVVWDPTGSGKQTIRAAFTLMHESPELFYTERWTTNPPYVSSISLTSGQFSNPFAGYTLNGKTGDPFPGVAIFPTQGAYISVPPNLPPTYMMQWNLSYQRQISANWLVTANYMGNASRHIWGSTDVNYAVPGPGATVANENQRRLLYLANPSQGQYYSGIIQTDPGGDAEYNALFLSVEHHFARHYTVTANYTWSHCISSWDFTGELAGPQYQNPLNRAEGERAACDWDHRHNFVTTMVVESPGFGEGWARKFTEGWMLSPIFNLMTGAPFTITDGKDISLTGQGNDRPNVIAPNAVFDTPRAALPYWFNPAAFECAGSNPACSVFSGQFGNLGRNALYGPGSINWDMNVTRLFQVTERWQLQLRADFFNILNHGNWGNPGTTVSSSGTFGAVTGFSGPRIVQMAVKVYF